MKKKISKLLAVLLSVVILLTNAIPAFAALTEGTKYSFTTKYLDAYYDTGTWQTADGHTHDNYGQVALRNLTSTGEPLYCLQIYNAVNSDAATASAIKNTNLWKNELSGLARDGITLTSIYGYPNYTYGFSAQDAQLATQVLIWDFEIGRRTGYAVKTTAFAEDIFANYPNAKKCYLKIIEACSNHQNRPSFNSSTVTLKGTGSSNSVTITDTNGVLSNYKIQSVTNNRIKASISGNKLTVYCTGTGALSGRIIFTKDCTDINSSFALTGANQTLFYGTIADPVNAPLTIELSLGSITVHKNSEDGDHSNEFIIKGNGINKTVKTDSNGLVTLNDLPEGTYTVTEVNRNKYYPHTEAKTVTVVAGQNSNVYFNNLLIKGKITLHKYGETLSTVTENEDGTYTPIYKKTFLPNAEYKVYAAEDIVIGNIKVAKNTLVDTIVTDSKGTASTKALYLKEDGTAKYKFIESKAPYGNVLDNEEHIVTLNRGNSTVDVTSSLETFNERQTASITFNKSIELDNLFNIGINDEILNVKFGLYAESDITAADGTTIPAGALIESMSMSDIVTEDAGKNPNELIASYSVQTDIPFGTYYIQEIATDNHYILDDTKYPFTFSYTNQNESTVNIQINNGQVIINTLKRGEIQGLKLDDSGNPLAGATIGLFSADTEDFTEDTALLTTVSADDGTFTFSNLAYGKYIVKELIAPDDYLLDENSYPVEITDNEQIVTLELINVLKRGNIQGVKLDDSSNTLAGAIIGIFSAETEEYTDETALLTTVSAEDGTFSFAEIPVGSYIIKELEAPDNYLLDPNSYSVELTENEQIVTLEIVNVLKRGSIQGLKLDNNGNPLADAVIGLFPADNHEFTENTAIMTTTSANDGMFSFNNIPVGTYIVRELEAPEGYTLDDKQYEVNIIDDGQIINVTIVNTLKIGKLTLTHNYLTSPKTGAEYAIFTIALITAVATAFMVVFSIAKKRKVQK